MWLAHLYRRKTFIGNTTEFNTFIPRKITIILFCSDCIGQITLTVPLNIYILFNRVLARLVLKGFHTVIQYPFSTGSKLTVLFFKFFKIFKWFNFFLLLVNYYQIIVYILDYNDHIYISGIAPGMTGIYALCVTPMIQINVE